jgi:sec-independent protein translocase protein TatB
MLDFSFTELIIILFVAVIFIGPKEIPELMYGLGRLVRRLQYIRFAFSKQFEDFMQQNDLGELQKGVNFEAPDYDEKAADEQVEDTERDQKVG